MVPTAELMEHVTGIEGDEEELPLRREETTMDVLVLLHPFVWEA